MPKDCYEIVTNYNCDLRCRFCSQGDFNPALFKPLKTAIAEIYKAKQLGYRRLGFSGGEALLRPELPKLIGAARHLGFKFIRLQTDAVRLSDMALAKKLVDAGLTLCKFTFLSSKAAVHNRLTGKKGSFARSLAGLKNMRTLKAGLGVNILINRLNCRDLVATLDFFLDQGVSSFVLIYPIYTGNMAENAAELGVSLGIAAPEAIKALDRFKALGLIKEIKVLNIPPCLLGPYKDRAAGRYKFNTVVSTPAGESWDLDENVKREKVRLKECRACRLRRRCFGVDRRYFDFFPAGSVYPAGDPPLPRGTAASAPGRVYLNNMEKCFMEILKKESRVSTTRALEIAKGLPLCHDCRDGASVLSTGQILIKKGLVSREFKGGKYLWALK
ncbi:MAG: radical SAM protein [Elusimicrobia bacterium]|nr:radical SAM protein [Elusimicrobiota bacterium]